MRRRSCAIHSDTQQQFMMLAEKSQNKTGIFYDERLYAEVQKIQSELNLPKQQNQNQNAFIQFDYDEVKQFERDEKNLNSQMQKEEQQVTIKSVIICDSVLQIKEMLSNQPSDRNDDRKIDLTVKKLYGRKGEIVIIKYWVMDYLIIHTPLAQIYIESAEARYWVSAQECKLKNFKEYKIEELQKQLSNDQKLYEGVKN